MLGAIIGDIAGSIYEFDNVRRKDFGPLLPERAFFTDDTVCIAAVADALINERHAGEALKDWGLRYWFNGGWGIRFGQWLQSDSLEPYGSFGNGAAMRISPVGLLARSEAQVQALSDQVTAVTHDHPEGLKGAHATALAIFLARRGERAEAIRDTIAQRYGYDMRRSVDDIRAVYLYNETCQQTVPEALICAFEANDFEDAIRNAISIGGDSDTVAAIAGGVAEALFGVPPDIADQAKGRLPDDIGQIIGALYRVASTDTP